MLTNNRIELMSPAGSPEALRAAVENGCDAVYMGGRQYGARHSAVNFDEDELERSVDYCHINNVNVYLTVNTLYRNDELSSVLRFVEAAYRIGVDALIVQDIGLGTLLARWLPDIPLHASTQMTAHHASDLLFLREAGFCRVVLAREASITEVAEMAAVPGIECEVFVHGALCVSYSGQCLFSSFLGGRSGNRGRCAQPCRLQYTLAPSGYTGHLLSPRDVITLGILDELINTGVRAFKIEGRMRSPEYVAHATRMYREALDRAVGGKRAAPEPGEINRLAQSYHRGGEYCEGYFHAHSGLFMMNPQGNYDRKESGDINSQPRMPLLKKPTLKGSAVLRKDVPATLTLSGLNSSVTVYGAAVEEAVRRPMTRDEVIERLQKTGSSPFDINMDEVAMDDNTYVNIKEINALRRAGVDAYVTQYLQAYKRKRVEIPPEAYAAMQTGTLSVRPVKMLTASVVNAEQFEGALEAGVNVIYFELTAENTECLRRLQEKARQKGIRLYAALPRVNKPFTRDLPVHGYLARTWGQLYALRGADRDLQADYTLNIMNSVSAAALAQYAAYVTLSPELSLRQLCRIQAVGLEVIVYGRIPLLLTRQCPIGLYAAEKNKPAPRCQAAQTPFRRVENYMLKDRKGKDLPLLTDCDSCLCMALNADTLYMADKPDDLRILPQERMRLLFTTETREETSRIIKAYRRTVFNGEAVNAADVEGLGSFTRGHFYKGVL